MNVYDFDGTIYRGDSTADFYRFALKRDRALLRFLPRQLWGAIRYVLRLSDKTEMKERFLCFLRGIDAERTVRLFWERHDDRIMDWYRDAHEDGDVVISASPEFLLQPICDRLGVGRLIASRVDPKTGKFQGKNCRGAEKTSRLRECMGDVSIDRFYSDSTVDLPLAKMARRAYLVKNGEPTRWRV